MSMSSETCCRSRQHVLPPDRRPLPFTQLSAPIRRGVSFCRTASPGAHLFSRMSRFPSSREARTVDALEAPGNRLPHTLSRHLARRPDRRER